VIGAAYGADRAPRTLATSASGRSSKYRRNSTARCFGVSRRIAARTVTRRSVARVPSPPTRSGTVPLVTSNRFHPRRHQLICCRYMTVRRYANGSSTDVQREASPMREAWTRSLAASRSPPTSTNARRINSGDRNATNSRNSSSWASSMCAPPDPTYVKTRGSGRGYAGAADVRADFSQTQSVASVSSGPPVGLRHVHIVGSWRQTCGGSVDTTVVRIRTVLIRPSRGTATRTRELRS
jgi:hypothetical protein